MDGLYIILEMHQVVTEQPLRLADWVVAGHGLPRYNASQVNALDVVPHLGNAAKGTHLFLVALRFIVNAE